MRLVFIYRYRRQCGRTCHWNVTMVTGLRFSVVVFSFLSCFGNKRKEIYVKSADLWERFLAVSPEPFITCRPSGSVWTRRVWVFRHARRSSSRLVLVKSRFPERVYLVLFLSSCWGKAQPAYFALSLVSLSCFCCVLSFLLSVYFLFSLFSSSCISPLLSAWRVPRCRENKENGASVARYDEIRPCNFCKSSAGPSDVSECALCCTSAGKISLHVNERRHRTGWFCRIPPESLPLLLDLGK